MKLSDFEADQFASLLKVSVNQHLIFFSGLVLSERRVWNSYFKAHHRTLLSHEQSKSFEMLNDFTVHTINFQLCPHQLVREKGKSSSRTQSTENFNDMVYGLSVWQATKSDAISLSTCTCRALKNEQQRATFKPSRSNLMKPFEEMQIEPLVACYFFRVQRRDE